MNAKQRRQYRRAQIRRLKERIEKDVFNGIFTSDHIINNSGFVDFAFVGTYKGKEVIWNATISTTKGDYFSKLDNLALDQAYEEIPDPEGFDPFSDECMLPNYDAKGKIVSYTWNTPEEYNNLWKQRRKRMVELTVDMLDKQMYSIPTEQVKIDETYRYGIGLQIRKNIDAINVEDIYEFIENFNGKEYISKETFSANMQELGLTVKGDFIVWNKPFSHNHAALNIGSEA